MVGPDNPPSNDTGAASSDEEALRRYGDELATAVEAALGPWVEASVARVAEAWRPGLAAELAASASAAGRRATEATGAPLRALLAADPDDQGANPLAIIRTAVAFPTEVLAGAGVGAVVRDEFEERALPEDRYGLSPATWADLGPEVAELGLRWGAAKAHVVLARRRGAS